jgi:hypothetical protein
VTITKERIGLVKFDGFDQTIIGPDLRPGDESPNFIAVGQDWSEVLPLKASAGEVIILASGEFSSSGAAARWPTPTTRRRWATSRATTTS